VPTSDLEALAGKNPLKRKNRLGELVLGEARHRHTWIEALDTL
jgi:hypothetical protein